MENKSSGLLDKVKNATTAILGGRRFTSAVILAGGSGTRVGADRTKQMITLCGMPLIVHALLAFEKSEFIDEIVVVAKADELECYGAFRTEYGISKLTNVVCGGKTRQQSAKNGFDAISEKADYVAIHDGARALITPVQIKEVVLSAYAHGAAIAASRSTDTVKYAEGGRFAETLDRAHIWLAQTPQVFRDEIYRAAAYTAEQNGFEGTDDASLVENIGIGVQLVDCGADNFKVTVASDLLRAEAILQMRGEKK